MVGAGIGIAAAIGAGLLCVGKAESGGVAFPGTSGLIVFTSEREFNGHDLWVARRTGEVVKKLTSDGGSRGPAWSPDGRRIAYEVNGRSLAVLNVGTGRNRILAGAQRNVHAVNPAWAPDGARIVFSGTFSGDNEADLYVIEPSGARLSRLVHIEGCESHPAWSPDGRVIAFVSGCEPPYRVFMIAADGGSAPRLVDDGQQPVWSSDGSKLAVFRDGGLWILDLQKRDGRRLVLSDINPTFAWSPDGSMFVVERLTPSDCLPYREDRLELVNMDGTSLRHLFFATCGGDSDPDWQPVCTRYGTTGRDRLVGTSGPDVLCALDGDDTIYAGAGDDVIIGGNGNDTIYGGSGKDRLFGSLGNDRLVAADDMQDVVDGGPGRDRATVDGARDLVAGVESRRSG